MPFLTMALTLTRSPPSSRPRWATYPGYVQLAEEGLNVGDRVLWILLPRNVLVKDGELLLIDVSIDHFN